MDILPLTVFLSSLLGLLFLVLFLNEHRCGRKTSPDHAALLPLADDDGVPASKPAQKRSSGQGARRVPGG